jgi:hypothetical protein
MTPAVLILFWSCAVKSYELIESDQAWALTELAATSEHNKKA